MLHESVTVKMVEKLTAVPLITSIRASPRPPIASKGGGDTLAIVTSKLGGAALTCINIVIIISNDLMASTAFCLFYTSKDLYPNM